MWIWLVLLYGLLKGTREIIKKKSMQKSPVVEVLFFYTLFAFIFVSFDIKNAGGVPMPMLGFIFMKSLAVFCAWILSFKAIKKMPISLYGVLDLSRVLFATLLGSIVLKEVMSTNQIIGLILVVTGLLLLKLRKKGVEDKKDRVEPLIIIFALLSCLLNALSGLMDKLLMQHINSSQLQFYFMLFLLLLYGIYFFIKKEQVNFKRAVSNPWIWLLAFLFVIADRSLFIANADPASKVTVMTLIKQAGCVVTLLAGKFIYHEKEIGHRAFCTLVVVAGIVVAVL